MSSQALGELCRRQDPLSGRGQPRPPAAAVQLAVDWQHSGGVVVGEPERGQDELGALLEEQPAAVEDGERGDARVGPHRRLPANSGGTGQLCSPSTPSSSRLVVRIDREAQTRSRRSARSATAAARCSQLSRTSSTARSPMCSAIVAVASCPGTSGAPRPSATACGAMAGSSTGASSTQRTPPGNRPRAASAAARASRVFPVPPGPVRLSSLLRARASTTSWSSRWRPTSGASRTGSRPVFSAATRPSLRIPCHRLTRCAAAVPRWGGPRPQNIPARWPPRPRWHISSRPGRRASWAWPARRPQRRRRRGPAGGSNPALAAGTPPASPGAGSPCTRERPRHSPAPPAAR